VVERIARKRNGRCEAVDAGLPKGLDKTAQEIDAEAIHAGIDLELVEHNLTLSPEARARQHDGALRLALELKRIGEEMRARDREAA
jgi:hypothetical protein